MDALKELNRYMKSDSKLSLNGMAVSLGINFAIAFGIFMVFNILRPNHSQVYAPRYKYATKAQVSSLYQRGQANQASKDGKTHLAVTTTASTQPPPIPSGMFSWIKPVFQTQEEVLFKMIGYDAVLFIRFMRMLRRLLYWMTAIGVCVLIPINVIATSYTGEWPPSTGLDFLSISTINYYDGKFHSDGNLGWYWAHMAGTWIFSLLILRSLWINYRDYVKMRQKYFESEEYQRSMHARTLVIFNVPASMQSDTALAQWVSSMRLKYPFQQVCIGRRNNQLAQYVEEHEQAVRQLEILISKYVKEDGEIRLEKRPTIRVGGSFFNCCGGRRVDAINYYTERIQTLSEEIARLRSQISANKPTSYGWISFASPAWAHAAAKQIQSSPMLLRNMVPGAAQPKVHLAPQPKDIIWSNLDMNPHLRRSKRLIGGFLFYGFVFLFFIPSSLLSASSNIKYIVRLFPEGSTFIKEHSTFVSLLGSWFSPIIMALFFFILPKILRLLSQQQGYMTETSLDRQVLSKLYIFFIVNHLLVFTVASTMLAMYSQIQNAVNGGTLTAQEFFTTMGSNLTQVAKNISDVSTFWVNYVCLKGLGVIMDLAQVFALVSLTLRKLFMRPSPRQLQEFTRPAPFDYSLFYNVLIFFFTIGLVYSVIAPLVLPFTLVYFLLATMVFKYLLMYVYVTNVETGGQIWRVLINRLLVSTILFQVVMILVLNFKGATGPAYSMIPLPILTVAFKLYCRRTFDPHVYYYTPATTESASCKAPSNHDQQQQNIHLRFGEPSFFSELPIPMIHERVRHILPRLYGHHHNTKTTLKRSVSTSAVTRKKSVRNVSTFRHGERELQFQTVTESQLELDESTEGVRGMYKFDPDNNDDEDEDPLPQQQQQPPPKVAVTAPSRTLRKKSMDRYAPTRPLMMEEDEDDDLEYFVAGKCYGSHDPKQLDESSSHMIEMVHLYQKQYKD